LSNLCTAKHLFDRDTSQITKVLSALFWLRYQITSFTVVFTLPKIKAFEDFSIWNIGIIAIALLYFDSTFQFSLTFSRSLTSRFPNSQHLERSRCFTRTHKLDTGTNNVIPNVHIDLTHLVQNQLQNLLSCWKFATNLLRPCLPCQLTLTSSVSLQCASWLIEGMLSCIFVK